MKITPMLYSQIPLQVRAVQVTEDNMIEVAEWCQGTIHTTPERGVTRKGTYIRVRTIRPLSNVQTMAYVGDWVLQSDAGFKVYNHKAFTKGFQPYAPSDESSDVQNPADNARGMEIAAQFMGGTDTEVVGRLLERG